MLKKYLPLLALLVIALSCNKDKLETKPSIKLKSLNGTEFEANINTPIVIDLEFADSEGDIGGGIIKYYRNRLNVTHSITTPLEDSVAYPIPEFPDKQRGEIQLLITSDRLNQNDNHNDTISWKIIVIDRAGNVSDTLATPAINDLDE